MDEIISEDLINKFIKRLKKEDITIKKEKCNIYKLNPNNGKNKVNKMKENDE